jgi:NitT/TauT family transport system substrate-binding protein
MRDLTRLAWSIAVALLATAAAATGAKAETAVRFTLDRKLDGAAAPYFLAIDKGYFRDEGLDVTITTSGGAVEAIERLAAGKDEMGVSDLNTLIKVRDAAGSPIKAVFVVFDKPPYAVIARKGRGIDGPRDLQGKTLAAPAADPAFAQWPVFAKVNGIESDKVAVEDVSFAVREPMLAAGEVDAITGFSFTAYVDLKSRGVPADDLTLLPMADYGLALYGDAIMVAPGFAQDKPAAVRGFLRAYVRALKDTVRDPARAVDAALRRIDGASKTVELERLRMALRNNIVTLAVRANGFGGVDPQRFAAAIDQLALAYRFRAKDKAAAAVDLSFLPPAAERQVEEGASR